MSIYAGMARARQTSHDIAHVLCLCMQATKWALKQAWSEPLRHKWYYRHLSAAAGCCNIIALMLANLVSQTCFVIHILCIGCACEKGNPQVILLP